MSKNSTLSRFTPACLAGLVLSLAGCATAPGPGAAPVAEDIGSRAQARWDRVLAGDFSGAYEFLSPGFRSSVTPDQYLRSMLGRKV
ncbi:MAG: hypothetical protein GWM87_12565, partial [Xanthomonadales bacterium]|nr:hypothetical protein [Xanthomonadales bacterium]NIX13672.1 hypothetical protein [Xanthomonadales bacterium]